MIQSEWFSMKHCVLACLLVGSVMKINLSPVAEHDRPPLICLPT